MAQLTHDFTFWFPDSPYNGWHHGRAKAEAFFQMGAGVLPAGLISDVVQVTSHGTNAVFEVRSHEVLADQPYKNQAVIAFDIKDSKIGACRKYWGVVFQLGQ